MKKQFKAILPVFLAVMMTCLSFASLFTVGASAAAWKGTSATSFASGSGTSSSPYIIQTAEQLAYLAKTVSEGNTQEGVFFELAADIDLGGVEWLPIGVTKFRTALGTADAPFSGTFDGRGYSISNLTVTTDIGNDRIGLFGLVSGGTVKNVVVKNAKVTGTSSGSYIGTIVGQIINNGFLISCSNDKDCTVTGKSSVGGIAGRIESGTVAEYLVNYASTDLFETTSNGFSGGIAGCLGNTARLRYSANFGKSVTGGASASATATSFYTGGIVGVLGTSSTGASIEFCYNAGEVSGRNTAGGIIGRSHTIGNAVSDSYNISTAVTDATNMVGGVVGWIAHPADFARCYTIAMPGGDIVGNNSAGQTDLTGTAVKTAAELKVLTDAIDAEIKKNTVTAGSTAPETANTDTAVTQPPAPDATTPGSTSTSPETTPITGDATVFAAFFAVISAAAIMITAKLRKNV